MYCINCGRKIGEKHRYCAVCGADQHPDGYNTRSSGFNSFKENDKALAIISYIGVLSLVSYFITPKNNSYARFHAVQGLNLFILECILGVTRAILSGGLFWSRYLRMIVSGTASLVGVGLLVLAILGIVYASRGEMTELPVISSLKIVKD